MSTSPACSALSASTPVAYGLAMFTSRPCFSKKPCSSAIARPSWSMPDTMPALSSTRSSSWAFAIKGMVSARPTANASRLIISFSSSVQRLHPLYPEGPREFFQVRPVDSAHLHGISAGSGNPAQLLKFLNVKALRREGQRDENIYPAPFLRDAVGQLSRCRHAQPDLPHDNRSDDPDDDLAACRAQRVAPHAHA